MDNTFHGERNGIHFVIYNADFKKAYLPATSVKWKRVMEKEEGIQRYVIQVLIKGVVKAIFAGCVEWKSETSRAGKSALHTRL